jgi:excisionase family DNA binding protein
MENSATYQILLTVNEVAKILGVSKTTVYRRINEGKFEAIQIGHSVRVLRSAIVDGSEQGSATGAA